MTLCLYGFVSGIGRKTEVLLQTVSLGLAILINVLGYYFVCNMAHKVYLSVRLQICLLKSASSMRCTKTKLSVCLITRMI